MARASRLCRLGGGKVLGHVHGTRGRGVGEAPRGARAALEDGQEPAGAATRHGRGVLGELVVDEVVDVGLGVHDLGMAGGRAEGDERGVRLEVVRLVEGVRAAHRIDEHDGVAFREPETDYPPWPAPKSLAALYGV